MKCAKCGAVIPDNSRFCLECGSKIETKKNDSDNIFTRRIHYSYGNNQSCGGKSDIVVRNGFVYYIVRDDNRFEIRVAPLSDNDNIQTLYSVEGPGSFASCINMVEDELIFYEHSNEDSITAVNVYSGEKRDIIKGYAVDSVWIENELLLFTEKGCLFSAGINGENFFEYSLPFKIEDRIFGYNGRLYVISQGGSEVFEILYGKNKYRSMEFSAGGDMIYGIIGNLYFSPSDEYREKVILCKSIDSLEVNNGIKDIERLVTAFEQYVIFSRANEKSCSFAWNVQTLRVYKLNRYLDLIPYSFSQALSDYILIQNERKLYKIPAPVFFQGDEPVFDDERYLFVEL